MMIKLRSIHVSLYVLNTLFELVIVVLNMIRLVDCDLIRIIIMLNSHSFHIIIIITWDHHATLISCPSSAVYITHQLWYNRL